MFVSWMLGIAIILTLGVLFELIRVRREQQRYQREVQAKLASLAHLFVSSRTRTIISAGLSQSEVTSLMAFKQRDGRRVEYRASEADTPNENEP